MYTQCTSCKTLFRITDEQLASVGGKVRCGFCYGTFNAYEALFEEIPDIDDVATEESTEGSAPASGDSTSQATEEGDAGEFDTDLEDNGPAVTHHPVQIPSPPLPTRAALPAPRGPVGVPGEGLAQRPALAATLQKPLSPTGEMPPWPTNNPRRSQDLARTRPSRHLPAASPRTTPAPAPTAAERVAPPLFPFPTAEPVAVGGPAFGAPELGGRGPGTSELPRLFDAIDVAGKELQQVSRVQLDRRPRNRTDTAAESRGALAWALATLLLVAFIVVQYGYFMRNDLARFPQLRPWLEKICDVTGCTIPLMYSPHLIKLVSRDIRTHPTEGDALRVRARILNEASYPQTYPVLSVELSDMNGKVIASRLFQPTEYLPTGVDVEAGIAPKAHADIQLDLLDPSHAAVGFEFSFL